MTKIKVYLDGNKRKFPTRATNLGARFDQTLTVCINQQSREMPLEYNMDDRTNSGCKTSFKNQNKTTAGTLKYMNTIFKI